MACVRSKRQCNAISSDNEDTNASETSGEAESDAGKPKAMPVKKLASSSVKKNKTSKKEQQPAAKKCKVRPEFKTPEFVEDKLDIEVLQLGMQHDEQLSDMVPIFGNKIGPPKAKKPIVLIQKTAKSTIEARQGTYEKHNCRKHRCM